MIALIVLDLTIPPIITARSNNGSLNISHMTIYEIICSESVSAGDPMTHSE